MSEVPRTQFLLSEEDVPLYWYNILADLEFSIPQEYKARFDTASDTGEAKLMAQIPLSMYRQSISQERFIEIPELVRDEYQMELTGDFPDVVIGCMGAGSNFASLAFPFYREKIRHRRSPRLVAVEPEACPKMTRGRYTWDYNDFSGITPMTKMYTLSHTFISPGIHAGGLRYHGVAPIVSAMYHHGLLEVLAYPQRAVFEAGKAFAQTEKFIPAPKSAHAVKCTIDETSRAREEGRATVIPFNVSGHGLMDLSAYELYPGSWIEDSVVADEQIAQSLARIPVVEGE